MPLRAWWNGFAGRIWPAGSSLETPVVEYHFGVGLQLWNTSELKPRFEKVKVKFMLSSNIKSVSGEHQYLRQQAWLKYCPTI